MAKTKRAFARDYRVLAGNMELSKLCPQEISKKITPCYWHPGPGEFHTLDFLQVDKVFDPCCPVLTGDGDVPARGGADDVPEVPFEPCSEGDE